MENLPVILDVGTQLTRIGFGDCRKNDPDIIFNSSEAIQNGKLASNIAPTSTNAVADSEQFEDIANHALMTKLKICSENHPLLLIEKPGLELDARQRILELAFEALHVPAFHLSSEPLMALYSVGLSSGIVLSSGNGSSYVSTVHEGHRPPYGVIDLGFSGRDVTKFTRMLIKDELGKEVDFNEAEQIKCKHTHVNTPCTNVSQDSSCGNPSNRDFEKIGPMVGEMLIKPGKCSYGFADAISRCIYLTDEEDEYEPVYFRNIMLCGGSTLFPGLKERLEHEIIPPDYLSCGVRVIAPPFRQHASWIGGSVSSSLPTFKPFWITKEDYAEHGKNILRHKCLQY